MKSENKPLLVKETVEKKPPAPPPPPTKKNTDPINYIQGSRGIALRIAESIRMVTTKLVLPRAEEEA